MSIVKTSVTWIIFYDTIYIQMWNNNFWLGGLISYTKQTDLCKETHFNWMIPFKILQQEGVIPDEKDDFGC